MGPVSREQILSALKARGPLVPNDLKKIITGDTMIFGAILSELSARGMVNISILKKGGSPFYYLPEHVAQLERMIEFLNPKDQKTVFFLKENKVVFDKQLELFQRVSLRKVPDFAKELKVNTSDGEMLFWRYFLVSEQEAMNILKERYNNPKKEEVKPEPVDQEKSIFDQAVEEAEHIEDVGTIKESIAKEKLEEQKQNVNTQTQREEPKPAVQKKEDNTVVQNKIDELKKRALETKPETKETTTKSNTSKKLTEPKTDNYQQKLATTQGLEKTPFYDSAWSFFNENKIDVLEENLISKDREYEFVISVPSAIGNMNYYCRARNKKKLNEGDVAPALLKAKTKDMPCLFLTNGEFTKKSEEMMNKEYTGLVIKIF